MVRLDMLVADGQAFFTEDQAAPYAQEYFVVLDPGDRPLTIRLRYAQQDLDGDQRLCVQTLERRVSGYRRYYISGHCYGVRLPTAHAHRRLRRRQLLLDALETGVGATGQLLLPEAWPASVTVSPTLRLASQR